MNRIDRSARARFTLWAWWLRANTKMLLPVQMHGAHLGGVLEHQLNGSGIGEFGGSRVLNATPLWAGL